MKKNQIDYRKHSILDLISLVSSISNKTYHTDETGVIIKIKNPFNDKKQILLLAGKRYAGTKAVIISFLRYFDEVCKGNKYNNKVYAKVIEGIDLDSDGIVDDVSILEWNNNVRLKFFSVYFKPSEYNRRQFEEF